MLGRPYGDCAGSNYCPRHRIYRVLPKELFDLFRLLVIEDTSRYLLILSNTPAEDSHTRLSKLYIAKAKVVY